MSKHTWKRGPERQWRNDPNVLHFRQYRKCQEKLHQVHYMLKVTDNIEATSRWTDVMTKSNTPPQHFYLEA